jgi:EmrB/QacA subfamily drug resistance transporter
MHHARLLALAAGAAFLALLDVTVVNLAIPALGRAYPHAGLTTLSWVITAYATLFAALLAPAGRLSDVIGRRTLFRTGVAGFAVMSLVCALSPSVPVLLAARGLQGVFAAAMIPASLAIVLTDTPAESRVASIGVWSAAGAFAAAVGPSVGGVLVHGFGWRSLFLINVPAGAALAWFGRAVPSSERARTRLPDALGTVLLAGGIGLAALGLSQGATWGWGNARTIAALAGGVVGVLGAVARSWRLPMPAIETGLWKHRAFALANGASFAYGVSLYAWMLLGVLVLTQLWHYSELTAGLAMTPGAIAASIAAIAAGRASMAPRTATAAGAALMTAIGLTIAATLPSHANFLGYWLPLGLVLGAGMGLVTTGTSTAAAVSLPPQSFAAGTGLNQTARQVGGALGIATLATLVKSGSHGVGTFEHVYVFVSLAAAGAGIIGLGLGLRPAVATAPAAEAKAGSARLAQSAHLAGSDRLAGSARLPFRRFVVVGDSMAAGTGDPAPGYEHVGWADLVSRALDGGAAYLNLGRRGLLASEVRATQLSHALAFRPDLAAVLCGGNDLMRRDVDPVTVERELDAIVGPLRDTGCEVVMMAPFDMSESDALPDRDKPAWHALIEAMTVLARRVASRHGAVLVDFRSHPAGAAAGIYSSDRIHLNARGHAIVAEEVVRTLSAGDARTVRAA